MFRPFLLLILLLVAALPTPAKAQQTTREAAARKWHASQNLENRSFGSRTGRRSGQEARQQVRLNSREAAGGRPWCR